MYYAKVIGKVISTIKYKGLKGKKLLVIQPVDTETGEETGNFLVAVDSTYAGYGDYVGYEDGKEACWPFEDEMVPSDATIVAIIDSINVKKVE